jgi:hypothetical protein
MGRNKGPRRRTKKPATRSSNGSTPNLASSTQAHEDPDSRPAPSPPQPAIPPTGSYFDEMGLFLRAIRAVFWAVMYCWPSTLISLLLGYVLLQTGQGFEVVLDDLLGPYHAAGLFFGLCYFAAWIVQYTDEFLTSWRAGEADHFTVYGRYEAPILIAAANPLIFALLLTDIPKLTPTELEAFKTNSSLVIFAMLMAPAVGRFFTVTNYKHASWREWKTFRLAIIVAFTIAAYLYQLGTYSTGTLIAAWSIYFMSLLVFDWFIVVRSHSLSLARTHFTGFPQAGYTMIILVAVLGSLFINFPLARWLGAPLILLLAVAFWTSAWCAIALIAIRFSKRARLLGLTAVGACMLLLVTGPYNEAKLRTLAKTDSHVLTTSVSEYFEKWLDTRRTEILRTGSYPVVIVTAEGGGIRAAYWTGGILMRLRDHPGWGDHIIAVSAVSGGAVGAGVYAGLVAASHDGKLPCQDQASALYPCMRKILSADLLPAPLAYMLVNDALHSMFRRTGTDDRTSALEQALEEAFLTATGSTILSGSYTAPWQKPDPRDVPPLVVSNMTVAGGGQRAVLSPMMGGTAFEGAVDVTAYVPPESLRISTAAVLSARFPLISATALIEDKTRVLRLVDGGYADNSGAATAIDLVRNLLQAAERVGVRERIAPVVVPIKNGEAQSAAAKSRIGQSLIGSFLDPLATLDGVRATSASRYEAELARYMAAAGGTIVGGFELKYGTNQYPLGWTLSAHTIQLLDAQIEQLVAGAPGATLGSLLAQDKAVSEAPQRQP